MATLTLKVPDELLRRARRRLGGARQRGVNEYLRSALESLAMEGEPIDSETEARLLKGLDSPLKPMTESDWRGLLKRATKGRKR